MRRLLACLVLAGSAGPAAACLNDTELTTHEHEFRSQYNRPATPPPETSPEPRQPSNTLLVGAGTTLLVGAVGLVLTGRRARS